MSKRLKKSSIKTIRFTIVEGISEDTIRLNDEVESFFKEMNNGSLSEDFIITRTKDLTDLLSSISNKIKGLKEIVKVHPLKSNTQLGSFKIKDEHHF